MIQSMRGVKAVILDWAGTTVDYGSRAPTRVFIEMFSRRGIEITEAEAREPMGMSKREHIATIASMPRVQQAWIDRYKTAPSAMDIDAIYAEFLPFQKATLAHHSQVIPGVAEAVAELRGRGIKIGSSTGYTRELMEVVVPLAASGGYTVDAMVCSDDVASGRPAPWMNFRVAELLGVYPIDRIVVVDDTPIGIAAGLNAGAITVAVTKTGNAMGLSQEEVDGLTAHELSTRLRGIEDSFRKVGAHYVIESVAELPRIMD